MDIPETKESRHQPGLLLLSRGVEGDANPWPLDPIRDQGA